MTINVISTRIHKKRRRIIPKQNRVLDEYKSIKIKPNHGIGIETLEC